jgi:hypothetical protein
MKRMTQSNSGARFRTSQPALPDHRGHIYPRDGSHQQRRSRAYTIASQYKRKASPVRNKEKLNYDNEIATSHRNSGSGWHRER